jgi:putative transcriptional regulator
VPPAVPDAHAIAIHLDKLLADRGMTLTELSERAGVSVVNLSILKNGHARAIRFSTLTRLCQVLDCQPGDLLSHDRAAHLIAHPSRPQGHRLPGRASPAGTAEQRPGQVRSFFRTRSPDQTLATIAPRTSPWLPPG